MMLDSGVAARYGADPDPDEDAARREAEKADLSTLEALGWTVHTDPYNRGGIFVARNVAKLRAMQPPPVEIRAGDPSELKEKVLAHIIGGLNNRNGD